jgi:hypothetical protein
LADVTIARNWLSQLNDAGRVPVVEPPDRTRVI